MLHEAENYLILTEPVLTYARPVMSLPTNIDDVLRGQTVEWERLEFKQGWNPKAVLHTMCAFASDFHNFGGGYILIGVAENQGQPLFCSRQDCPPAKWAIFKKRFSTIRRLRHKTSSKRTSSCFGVRAANPVPTRSQYHWQKGPRLRILIRKGSVPEGAGGDTFTGKTFAGPLDVILKDALTFLERLTGLIF